MDRTALVVESGARPDGGPRQDDVDLILLTIGVMETMRRLGFSLRFPNAYQHVKEKLADVLAEAGAVVRIEARR